MSENLTSRNKVIIKIILEEIEPLISKAEEITENFDMVNEALNQTKSELNEDLAELSKAIEGFTKTQETLQKKLDYLSNRPIPNNLQKVGLRKGSSVPSRISIKVIFFTSLIVLGSAYFFHKNYNPDRINIDRGKKLTEVWSHLSDSTKKELLKNFEN